MRGIEMLHQHVSHIGCFRKVAEQRGERFESPGRGSDADDADVPVGRRRGVRRQT